MENFGKVNKEPDPQDQRSTPGTICRQNPYLDAVFVMVC